MGVMKKLLAGAHGSQVRRNFRGRPVKGSMKITWNVPDRDFVQRVVKWEDAILYRTGGAMLKRLRGVLGKEPPTKYTKTGRESARWKKEIRDKGARAPYKRVGHLRNYSNFVVDTDLGEVATGPMLFPGHSGTTQTTKTIPQLLEEGGSARVDVPVFRTVKDRKTGVKTRVRVPGKTRTISVRYRSFAYKWLWGRYGIQVMKQNLAKRDL